MKSILLSIKPEWTAKILNGEKTIEVRKKFPRDYVGWVYLYCSKSKPYLLNKLTRDVCFWEEKQITANDMLNGKVVARFWCDKVESISFWYSPARAVKCVDYDVWSWETKTLDEDDLLYGSCLSQEDLTNYLCRKDSNTGYAIHISKLEIFDRPRELNEFKQPKDSYGKVNWNTNEYYYMELTKAPQNYCYIEGEQNYEPKTTRTL